MYKVSGAMSSGYLGRAADEGGAFQQDSLERFVVFVTHRGRPRR